MDQEDYTINYLISFLQLIMKNSRLIIRLTKPGIVCLDQSLLLTKNAEQTVLLFTCPFFRMSNKHSCLSSTKSKDGILFMSVGLIL